jgi:prepilin-type N-terminal cleavage/methylation domain-containing protein
MKTDRQGGFSLLELMLSVAILSIVIGVVVEGIDTMQARNSVEANKLDLTQETREFMDQIVNDLDQAGFPNIAMFDPNALPNATDCTQDPNVACGFRSVTSSSIQFEGDVDGSGVSEEWIQLVQDSSGAACTTPPCVIERGTVSKLAWNNGAGAQPPFYTEVNGVMNTTVFTAYQADGNSWTDGILKHIGSIGITLYVKSSAPDPKTGLYPTVTMVAASKVSNVQSY